MKKTVLVLALIAAVISFMACNTGSGTDDPATPSDANGPATAYLHNANIQVDPVSGETCTVEPEKRIEVRIDIVNIPSAVAAEGDVVTMVGFWLCDSNGDEFNWNNNDTSVDAATGLPKEGTSAEFVQTVASGSLSYTLFYDIGNDNTDFKFFEDGTWNDAIVDPLESDGNFKIVFKDNGFSAGDVARVTIDATNF